MKSLILNFVFLSLWTSYSYADYEESYEHNVADIRSKYRKLLLPTSLAQSSDLELEFIIENPSEYSQEEVEKAALEYQLRNDINSKHPSILLLPKRDNQSAVISNHKARQKELAQNLVVSFYKDGRMQARCKSITQMKLLSDFDFAIKLICEKKVTIIPCRKDPSLNSNNSSNSSNSSDSHDDLALESLFVINQYLDESSNIEFTNTCDGINVDLTDGITKDRSLRKNPIALNHVINNDYFNLSTSLANYTGKPLLPNWATFAQFGSRTVGRSMHLMEEALTILDSMDKIVNRQEISKISELADKYARLEEIVLEPNMPLNGLKKFLSKLSLKDCSLVNSGLLNCGIPAFGQAILDTKDELVTLYEAFKTGNRMIYNHMAPVLADFMNRNNSSPNCKVDVDSMYSKSKWKEIDPNGLIREALKEYQKAHEIDQKIIKTTDSKTKEKLLKDKEKAVSRANLLIVTQEQILAQEHLYHEDLLAYDGMNTVLYDPVGEYPLVSGNWADFNTRMGIPKEIKDYSGQKVISVRPEKVDELLSFLMPGTITDYFDTRTKSSDAEKLFSAPIIATSNKR